jgi:hypothetical protein
MEEGRIEFLVKRDGKEAACQWVERTAQIYRKALASDSHAVFPQYRPRFEQSVRDFDKWLLECKKNN